MKKAAWRLPQIGTRVGDYEVTGELAAGGHGSLMEAERHGRRYAIKFLGQEEVSSREEVQVLMRAQVEGVVRVHAYGTWPEEEGGCQYVVMDCVPGETADVYVHHYNLTAREVTHLVLQVASALAEVHRLGVLHRDLKPQNIMVHEQTRRPVLVDFGSGRITRFTPKDRAGLPLCTAEYVSPEAWKWSAQHRGGVESYPYGVGDELWALAVSYYELLTGRLPFGDRESGRLPTAVMKDTPEAPHVRNPRVPRELGEWVVQLLAKDPAARPPDMSALCEALREVLESAAGNPAWEVPLRSTSTPKLPARDGALGWSREVPGERALLKGLKAGQGRAPPAAVEVAPTAVDARGGVPPEAPSVPAPPAPHRNSPPEADQEPPGRTEQGRPGSSPGAAPCPAVPPPPAAPARRWSVRQRASWGLWGGSAVALVLGALVWGLSPRSATEGASAPWGLSPGRVRGTCWQPPVPACLVREVAHPWEPAEADEGAEPLWALTPAPHPTVKTPPQDAMPQRNKAQKPPTRAPRKLSVGLCCLTATCAVLVGCPAIPARPTPEEEHCSPIAQETQKQYNLHRCTVRLLDTPWDGADVEVPVGRIIEARLLGSCGGLPEITRLRGYLTVEGDRAYPRFTLAWFQRDNNSSRWEYYEYHVCLQGTYNGRGVPIVGGASPGHVKIFNIFRLQRVDPF